MRRTFSSTAGESSGRVFTRNQYQCFVGRSRQSSITRRTGEGHRYSRRKSLIRQQTCDSFEPERWSWRGFQGGRNGHNPCRLSRIIACREYRRP